MKLTLAEAYDHPTPEVDMDTINHADDWRACANAMERFVVKARAYADKLECGSADALEPIVPQTPVVPPDMNPTLDDEPEPHSPF